MGGSSQQPVTQQTTQSKDPWSAAQPGLIQAMSTAQSLQANNQGYAPYTGQTLANLDPSLQTSLAVQANMPLSELGGTPGVLAGRDLGLSMIQNQGLSPQLQDLLQRQQGDQNPYLQSILNTQGRQIGDRVNASMSGAGRYGSGQHTDVLARSLAEAADPLLAQDYQQRQQMQQGILESGLQRAGQWSQLMPTLDEARYAGANRIGQVGAYLTDRAQTQLNDQIKQYNAQQAYPWEQAARLNAIVGGAGGLGGQQVTTNPIQQPSSLQALLGGGIAGAGLGSMFGPVGAGVGAAGGGLLGLLGR